MPIFPLSSFDVLRLSESWLLGNSSKNMVSSLFSLVASILVFGFHLPSPPNTHPVRNRQVLLGGSRWPQQLCSGHGRWLLHLSGFRSAPGRPGKGPFHFRVVDKGTLVETVMWPLCCLFSISPENGVLAFCDGSSSAPETRSGLTGPGFCSLRCRELVGLCPLRGGLTTAGGTS